MLRLSKLCLEASRRSSHASWKWELPFGSRNKDTILSKKILQPPSAMLWNVPVSLSSDTRTKYRLAP